MRQPLRLRKTRGLILNENLETKHDPNAIKVIGCNKGFFGIKRRFIGYVPKDVSRLIVEGRYLNQICPRMLRTYVGDLGFVEIQFQILGPKEKNTSFAKQVLLKVTITPIS